MPTSNDSTVPSSRGGSFDSTGSTPAIAPSHHPNLSFGASDEELRKEETRMWSQMKSRHRRQKTSDGASTIASNASRGSDRDEGITMRSATSGPRPSRLVGGTPLWKPALGTDGFIVPYEPDRRLLLPDPPEDVALREFSRLWFNLQAMNGQGAEILEREYGVGVDEAELEAEFGARAVWNSGGGGGGGSAGAAGSGGMRKMSLGVGTGEEGDGMRMGEVI